jgi:hypothetical protein
MIDWLIDKFIGDPTGAMAVVLFVGMLLFFKPTRIYLIASMLIYIVLI